MIAEAERQNRDFTTGYRGHGEMEKVLAAERRVGSARIERNEERNVESMY